MLKATHSRNLSCITANNDTRYFFIRCLANHFVIVICFVFFDNQNDLDFSGEQFGASQLMQCHFTELLIKLIRGGANQSNLFSTDAESRLLAKNSTAEMIIDHLENNIRSALTLDDLYKRFFIGKSQLNAIFHGYTGKSPMQYYNDLKIVMDEDHYHDFEQFIQE